MNSELRKYTRRNLRQSSLGKIIKSLSITNWIITINILVFIISEILIYLNPEFINYVAIKPSSILQGKYLWTIITSFFMHGSPSHLLVNMLSLFFIGNFVEKLIGRKRFFLFYLVSGIIASLFFVASGLLLNQNDFAVGASGAIFALGGVLMILTPKLPVLVFFIIPMPMWLAMLVLLGVLWAISFAFNVPIGNIAHLGGLLTGVAYGVYLRKKYSRKVQIIGRMFR